MAAPLKLISHTLCPYVQRAVIALTEKGIPFERIDIDLANKTDWFLKISPLGDGPFFAGEDFSLVDAVFAPIFRYFDVFDELTDLSVFAETPKVRAWRT